MITAYYSLLQLVTDQNYNIYVSFSLFFLLFFASMEFERHRKIAY